MYANPKNEKLSYVPDNSRGYWIVAEGVRGPRSADPGPYCRKIGWVDSEESAIKKIDKIVQSNPEFYKS